jgi:SAM-dependent methyltransferase
VGIADRIFPALTEAMGAVFEKKPYVVKGRRRLVADAHGRVLEIGAGTGFNLPYYPANLEELVVTDPLDGMLDRARRRADRLGRKITTRKLAGERLPFEDDSFDTVVASLVLCSVDDQDAVLSEIRRVLRPGGSYLFMEHVRSEDPTIARRQDRLEGIWSVLFHGCHPNRDTAPRIEAAFDDVDLQLREMPAGPKIVRPTIVGQARKTSVTTPSPGT